MEYNLENFTDILGDVDEIANSQPLSLPSSRESANEVSERTSVWKSADKTIPISRPAKRTGQYGDFRSIEEFELKYRHVFSYPYFNLVQSSVIEDAVYSDKSMVVCAPTGSGKTVVFEMAIVQLLMELGDRNYTGDFKIVYMAPVKALCTERLSEWYPKFTKLGLMCIEVTGDTNVDFSQLKPYRIIITTPEKWDMLTRRWRDHRGLVEVIKLFLIDEVHILNDETRGPVLEAVVSRMKTIEASQQSAHRIEQLKKQYQDNKEPSEQSFLCQESPPRIRFIAVSATVSNPDDVADWLGSKEKPAVYYKFGDECRPVKLKRVVEGYPCPEGMSIFKFDIILNYKLWPIIQKYHDGKPTLIFCNTRKSVALTAETLSRELTINSSPEQKAKLMTLASTIKNKKLQALILSGVGCHHAGLLYEERLKIEEAFRNRDLPILITTTTLAMGVNLPAHLVIIKNTQQYVNGAYQEYSISTVLQMVGRAGRPQFDTEATAVIMTRLADKARYQALVGGEEPLQSYLHKRLAENLNSEAALGTVGDVAQCVQWLRSTFLSVRAAKDPKRYLGLPMNAPPVLISKKIEELCVKAMNGLASAGLITMDEACCIESTEAGRLMSVFYLDLETMKHIMKIEGNETLENLLWIVCESHELADMHLRMDERRTLNALNRNNAAATIRFPMKGKINTRQMKLNCIIQAVLGCLPIPEPALNQEAMRIVRIADRVCKCLVAYVTRSALISTQPENFSAVLNAIILAKCVDAHMWENSPYVSKQLKGIGPTFSALLASAGKVNFTLLEESHPRDLERIMNKSAPAGNVLRKQVSLLPKYQLTATPVDEKRVTIHLALLNHHHLAENRENLTAGLSHKCYIVAGDSENHLLYFTSFKDQDLISVYDSIITFEITRKHRFEHKVFIHCISSNWVGLDVNCDYTYKNIEPRFLRDETIYRTDETVYRTDTEVTQKKAPKKQTRITDTYKERKRKTNEPNITQSKEKKKRDNALIQQFEVLKNSLEATSKQLKEDIHKSAGNSEKLVHEVTLKEQWGSSDSFVENVNPVKLDGTGLRSDIDLNATFKDEFVYPTINLDDLDNENDLIMDNKIDNLIDEIESEIYKDKSTVDSVARKETKNNSSQLQSSFFVKPSREIINIKAQSNLDRISKREAYKYTTNETKKRKTARTHSNYSFIDAIEKKSNIHSACDNNDTPKDYGFNETIKNHIDRFLKQTTKKLQNDTIIDKLMGTPDSKNITPNLVIRNNDDSEDYKTESVSDKHLSISQELPPVDIYPKDTLKSPQFNIVNRNVNTNLDNIRKELNNEKNLIDEYESVPENFGNKIYPEIETYKSTDNISINREKLITSCEEPQQNTGEFYKNNVFTMEENYSYCNEIVQNSMKDIVIDPGVILINGGNGNSENDIHKEFCPNIIEILEKPVDKQRQESANKTDSIFSTTELETDNKYHPNDTQANIVSLYRPVIHLPKHTRLSINGSTSMKTYSAKALDDSKLLANPTCPTSIREFDGQDQIQHSLECGNHIFSNSNFQDEEIGNEFDDRASKSGYNFEYRRPTAETKAEGNDFIYRNKYSFSATKIDLCTKDMPDHQLQIIRKIKLDLDVTEIGTKINNLHQKLPVGYTDAYELNSLSLNKDITEHPPCTISSAENLAIRINNDSTTPNRAKQYLTYSDLEQTETKLEELSLHNSKATLISPRAQFNVEDISNNTDSDKRINFNEDTKKNLPINTDRPLPYITETKVKTISNALKDLSNLQKIQKTKITISEAYGTQEKDIENKNTPGVLQDLPNDTRPHVPANKILNETRTQPYKQKPETNKDITSILQKYKSILRRDNKIIGSSADLKSFSQDERKNCAEKTKRPYKINEIHNVYIPLPKSLITVEATRSIRSTKEDFKEIKHEQRQEIPEIQGAIFDMPDKPKPSTVQLFETNEEGNIGNTLSLSPGIEMTQPETLEEFSIDQSMLNPRTLLQQCFSKDEDEIIITPPAEFCERNLLMTNDESNDDMIINYISQAEEDSKTELDRSIFEENSGSVLTPSKEIETWTFSNTDAETNFHSSFMYDTKNRLKSCTVMRQISPVRKDISRPTEPKKARLGQFKFTHKKKMKM